MQILEDIIIDLQPPLNAELPTRLIEVDLNSRLNGAAYQLNNQFSYNRDAFGSIIADRAKPNQVLIPVNNIIVLSGIADELSVIYYASPKIAGEPVMGKILFTGQTFEIGAAPINYDIDACCTIPSKIVIDVSHFNQGLPVSLVSIGSNNTNAATTAILDNTGNDYNNDFNDDFGGKKDMQIIYQLNSGFWQAYDAYDRFPYTISYKGKTASNFITIRKVSKSVAGAHQIGLLQ
ncbi:MAG: hypothetical protein JSS76_18975 [Bacteroidetes bacterium]|nr:hypothetical protein [Bacteroidota bacterium]